MKTRGSWVASANEPDTDFPIENLPFGRFIPTEERNDAAPGPAPAGAHPDSRSGPRARIGVAIGDQILDCRALLAAGASPSLALNPEDQALLAPLAAGDLNGFMALGAGARRRLRERLGAWLAPGAVFLAPELGSCLVPQSRAQLLLACTVGDYTDFYASIHHATAVGRLFRPDNPLLPNYRWVPIGYHGRSSTLGVSGSTVRRPWGQLKPPGGDPVFAACQRLDFELEVGFWVGSGNRQGEPIPIRNAEDHLFGLSLLNDWSARDIQAWEYQPLGPFLAKSFATTVSPWVVTPEALAPFRVPCERTADDPAPLPYLNDPRQMAGGGFDITLQVALQTAGMRAAGLGHEVLATTNLRHLYWTPAQMITHHASNGCQLNPGDLLGSGTVSGPDPRQAGSLLELTRGGAQALQLANGETRRFLEDGDSVLITGFCENPQAVRIGLGSCEARVVGDTQ